MLCARCGVSLAEKEAHEHQGRGVCEDCCVDLLSVLKPCDPWAVHCAKSSLATTGGRLTELQTAILRELKETGGLDAQMLADRLGISLPELEREAASLRHMEKLRATLRHGRKILCCW